jgi:hypothetical protein
MTDLYAGLDVSLELTNVCVVDGAGRLVHECRVGLDPEVIAAELLRIGDGFVRVGFEAGPTSGPWLGAICRLKRSLASPTIQLSGSYTMPRDMTEPGHPLPYSAARTTCMLPSCAFSPSMFR